MSISIRFPNAYPSPYSPEFIRDYKAAVIERITITQHAARSLEDKVQKGMDPQLTKLFNIEFKTTIDLYA